jgi:hypothetical protein
VQQQPIRRIIASATSATAGAADAAVDSAGAVTRTCTTRSASTYGSGFNRTP